MTIDAEDIERAYDLLNSVGECHDDTDDVERQLGVSSEALDAFVSEAAKRFMAESVLPELVRRPQMSTIVIALKSIAAAGVMTGVIAGREDAARSLTDNEGSTG